MTYYRNALASSDLVDALLDQQWPYEQRPQRSALEPHTTVMGSSRNVYQPTAGYPNGPSGEFVRPPESRRDAVFDQQYVDPIVPGQVGSQSGPGDESAYDSFGRFVQGAASLPVAGMGAVGSLMLQEPESFPAAFPGMVGGMLPGLAMMGNANAANPNDVWLNQFVDYMRRRSRGLDY